MNIFLTRQQADSIGWMDLNNRELIRSCFYLGYGPTFISEIVYNRQRDAEALAIVQSAIALGMNEDDEIMVF